MRSELIKAIQSGNEIKFYKRKKWRAKRAEILKRDHKECQMCRAKGRTTVNTKDNPLQVHHKIHLKDNLSLALADHHLITVCRHCHNKEHPEKLRPSEPQGFINEERW